MQVPSFLTNSALSLICFGGKGGVGKTTSATATALYIASNNPQKKILLASIDPAHSLMDSLKNCNEFKNLNVWEIDAHDSFQKFILKHRNTLKKILERGTFLDEKDISDLLLISLPGIDELMAVIELFGVIESNTYNTIILDTAPTGHAIKFLQMPNLIRTWSHVFDLMMEKQRYMSRLYQKHYRTDDTDRFIESFTNSAKLIERLLQDKSCEFVPVMLPDALSVNETSRFLSTLNKFHIQVKNIIINRVYPPDNCNYCNSQYMFQKKCIDDMMLHFDKYNYLFIPQYTCEVHGKISLLKFAEAMMESHSGNNPHPHYPHNNNHNAHASALKPEKSDIGELFNGIHRLPAPNSHIEFVLFGGKGGVGKTTLASATALTLSNIYPDKKILLFSTDPAHSLSDCLNRKIGNNFLSLKNNLFVKETDAGQEYKKLKQLYSKETRELFTTFTHNSSTVNVLFEKNIVDALMDMTPPGIDEIMALAEIIEHMDKKSFDIFILDTAPTGHLIRFLETPEVLLNWLRYFFNLFLKYKSIFRMPNLSAYLVELSKKIKKLLILLRNGQRSLFIPITIPTEMAYEETKDLICALNRLKIPVTQMILNMVHPPAKKKLTVLIARGA